jgi:hypothetical protein
MQTDALVKTQAGSLYLRKLCRHFAHRVPVTIADNQGVLEFPFGRCRIVAAPEQLRLSLSITDPDSLETAERLIAVHLQRMAPKELLEINWVREPGAADSVDLASSQ